MGNLTINNELKSILEENDEAIINCLYILMDINPYRASIFLDVYGKKSKYYLKKWKKMTEQNKFNWIKKTMCVEYNKDDLIEHICKAINLFRHSQPIMKAFELALQIRKEETKNV